MASLITILRSKVLETVRTALPGKWKVMVVDEHSLALLNSVVKAFDILQENVTVVDSIQNHREPQLGLEAIYILMPTSANIDRIIRDFSPGRQMYAGAHLNFIDGLSDQLLERLYSSPAEPYLQGCRELFINFWAIEAQVFSLKLPELFFSMFSPPRNENGARAARDRLEEDLHFVSKSVANVCITLNEYPYIRYYMPSHHPPLGPLKPTESTRAVAPPPEASARWRTNLARGDQARQYEASDSEYLSKLLALMVQANLDDFKKNNPDFGKQEAARPRATLIITDRSMDVMAPLIHEFTYQAMANDLLPIQDGSKYAYKFQSSKGTYEDEVAVLSDADTVYTDIRHMHMKDTIDKLMADFNKFMVDNAGFKGDGAANLSDMKDMLANLPQYQEQRKAFSLHLNMAQECMDIFERDKLPAVANVEQNCATGLTAEGKTPKHLVEEMVPLLDSREVINSNKVRIIALYIQHREGVPDEDRRRLYQHARLSLPEQDAVNALVHLGIRISRGPGDKDTKKKLKQKPSSEEEYELSRFKPVLRSVIEDQVADRLDQSVFPYVKDYPPRPSATLRQTPSDGGSLRSSRPKWHHASKTGGPPEIRQRLLLFVAGGMSYSEMREAYHLSNTLNKDIYIGSTHTFTPRQFVDDLKVLELGGVGSRARPNGLREAPAGKRPFQDFYDEMYFTKDAPAPAPAPARPPPSPVKTKSSFLSSSRQSAPSSANTESTLSVNSYSGKEGKEKEKKKKHHLFKW